MTDIIHCYNEAVSDKEGSLDFFVDDNNEGSNANSLVQRNDNRRKAVRIRTVSIDSFVAANGLSRLDILKIDAEGVEYDVMSGAKNTLERLRPKIILAIHPSLIRNNGNTLEEIYRLISMAGYRIFFEGKQLNEQTFCSQPDFFDVHLFPEGAAVTGSGS
jgi:hypothetical protein